MVEENWGGGGAVNSERASANISKCSSGCDGLTLKQAGPMHANPECALAQKVIVQVEHATVINSSAIQMLHFGSHFQYIFICADVRKNRESWMTS